MILSQKKIEEIAVAVTKDFNEFFFGSETKDIRRMARGTPLTSSPRNTLAWKCRLPIFPRMEASVV